MAAINQLDLAFVVDTTGSMGGLIAAAFEDSADVSLHDLKVSSEGATFSLYGGGQGLPTVAGRTPAGMLTVFDVSGTA